MSQIKKGDKVSIHYTGTLEDGTVFDSSEGHDPHVFTIGSGKVIIGLEEAVVGMSQGEKKTVTIPPSMAYGERQDAMMLVVPINQVPPDLEPEVGQKMEVGGQGGQILKAEVIEVTDSHISLDANPPLAGLNLTYAIEVVAVN